MKITFEGWYNEKGEELKQDEIREKGCVNYTKRLDGYFVGFEPISGTDEEGLEFFYDAVRVFMYMDESGKSVVSQEFVPWHDGDEVRNVEIQSWLREMILEIMKECPIPTV